MRHATTIFYLVLVGLAIISQGCNDDDAMGALVSGKVINAFTSAPVANAQVAILGNGPVTYTDSKGNFNFTSGDLTSVNHEEIEVNGFSGVAVAISHEDYRPIEANVNYNQQSTYKLAETTFPAYVYHPPVQLNDGINVTTLQDVDADIQLIQNGMDKLFRDDYQEIHSVLVYKDGQLIIEEYLFGNNDTIQFEDGVIVDKTPDPVQWSRTDVHYIASVNKALTSTLVGIALDQFSVPIDAKISGYLPDYAQYFNDPDKAALTFEDCVTMTSGLQWDEWSDDDLALLWKSDDFADFVLDRMSFGPGFEWRYNSALPNLMIKCLDNMSGGNVRDWAHQNFYSRLGIEDYKWQSQPDGYPEGAARIYLRSRDMLKIGITYLNNGMWNGTQVVPESWVNACYEVKESPSAGDYSYHFWLRSLGDVNYLSADGDGGNFINIFPEQNMVMVVTQGNYLKWPLYVNQVNDLTKNYILPALEE